MELVRQVRAWYELESYRKYKQADVCSAANQRAHNLLESTTYHDGERYWVGMLWTDDSSSLPNNHYSMLAQFMALEKRLVKDSGLKNKYTETTKKDLDKGYFIPVKPHDPQLRSAREF